MDRYLFVTVTFPLPFAGSSKNPMFIRLVTVCYHLAAGSPAAGGIEMTRSSGQGLAPISVLPVRPRNPEGQLQPVAWPFRNLQSAIEIVRP